MKLKELLSVCKESIILLSVPEENSLLDNFTGNFDEYNEREIVSIESFYQRIGMFKYGLIVGVRDND